MVFDCLAQIPVKFSSNPADYQNVLYVLCVLVVFIVFTFVGYLYFDRKLQRQREESMQADRALERKEAQDVIKKIANSTSQAIKSNTRAVQANTTVLAKVLEAVRYCPHNADKTMQEDSENVTNSNNSSSTSSD
jgi:predicted negative regulator of RcsB-dependent stress response